VSQNKREAFAAPSIDFKDLQIRKTTPNDNYRLNMSFNSNVISPESRNSPSRDYPAKMVLEQTYSSLVTSQYNNQYTYDKAVPRTQHTQNFDRNIISTIS